MRAPTARFGGIALGCVLLFCTTACGTGSSSESAASEQDMGPEADTATSSDEALHFGQREQWTTGVSVEVAPPRSFTPSESAYPAAEHAVVFDIVLRNEAPDPYKLSTMEITASADEAPAREIVDPRAGLTGVTGAGSDVPGGRSTRVSLAYAVPVEASTVTLAVQPAPELDPARYTGPY